MYIYIYICIYICIYQHYDGVGYLQIIFDVSTALDQSVFKEKERLIEGCFHFGRAAALVGEVGHLGDLARYSEDLQLAGKKGIHNLRDDVPQNLPSFYFSALFPWVAFTCT